MNRHADTPLAFGIDARTHPNTANEQLAVCRAEIERLRHALHRCVNRADQRFEVQGIAIEALADWGGEE